MDKTANKKEGCHPSDTSFDTDYLLESLMFLTHHFGQPHSAESLKSGLPLQDGKFNVDLFCRSSKRAGLASKVCKRTLDEISSLVMPVVLLLSNRKACILLSVDQEKKEATIVLPETGDGVKKVALKSLQAFYEGHAIFVRERHRYDKRTPTSLDIKSRHWFWGTIFGSWRIYRDVLLASFMINIFALTSPLFVMNVYDRVVPNQAFETLWVLAIGALIVFTFDLILKMLRSYFIDLAGKKSDILLSSRIMEKILGIKLEARPASVGSFAKNIQDFETIRDFITSSTVTTLVDLPFTLIILFVIFLLGGPIVLVPLICMFVIGLYSFLIQPSLRKSIEKTMRSYAQKNATLIESLTGIEAIKVTQAENDIQSKWEKVIGHIATWSIKTKLLSASASNISSYCQQVCNVGIVICGVYLISSGDLSMGALIASVMLSGRCLAPMMQVASLSTKYNQAKSSLNTLNQIMEMPSERQSNSNYVKRSNIQGKIEFDNVDFSYPNESILALRDVSFSIKPKEKVGIIGRIGSGKSTLEKIILGLYEPKEGSVRVDGVDIRQIDSSDLRKAIGCVTQDITLFYGSIKDNITQGASFIDDESLIKASNIAGVSEFTNKHPDGLEMNVGERGQFLSGGQRQSVAIARALLMNPPILLLDEPSSAMDNTTEMRLKKRLKEIYSDKTLVLVTHKTSMLDLVDRLIVIDHGKIVADGSKEQVFQALKQGKLRIE